jgi:hypothetical protein
MPIKTKSIKYALASKCLYDDSPGNKKADEQIQVDNVLKRLGLGKYQILESESPDFFVKFNSENSTALLGCELTRLYSDAALRGSSGKTNFEKWKSIATKLRKRLDAAGHNYLYGVVFFRIQESDVLKALGTDQALEELVRTCDQYSGQPTDLTFPQNSFPLLNELMDTVRLFKYEEPGILWWCAHLQSGEVLDPMDALIDVVKRKSVIAEGYNWNTAANKWLIILAESNGLSDIACDIDDPEISKHLQRIPFTKIILWERWNDDVIELFPVFRKLCDGCAMEWHFEHLPDTLTPHIVTSSHYPTRIRAS